MKTKKVYMALTDLKELRKQYGWSSEFVAEKIFCSSRTLNRLEAENGTSNYDIAQNIAELFDAPFEMLFATIDKSILEYLEKSRPIFKSESIEENQKYYFLYICRNALFGAWICGKTAWIKDYDVQYEIRTLHNICPERVIMQYNYRIPVINSKENWDNFFFSLTIGNEVCVIVSESCIRESIPYALCKYVVSKEFLKKTTKAGRPDVIPLSKYRSNNDIFLLKEHTIC